MAKRFTLYITIFLLIGIGLAPVISMFIRSLFVDGEFSLKNYETLFRSNREWRLLFNSLTLAGTTTFITVLLGVPLGTLFAKTDLPLKRLFTILFVIPLLIPSYILAIAWFYCLGRSGIVAGAFDGSVGIFTSNLLFSFPGALFVMVSALLPIVIILTMTYLRMVNPNLEEVAILYGSWTMVLRKITIPLITPGIALAALIVFILTLGEFGVPSSLRFDVYPVESFTQFSAFYDFNTATATAIPLGIITLMVLIVERLFLRKKTFIFRKMGSEKTMVIIPLGKTKPFLIAFVSILVFILVIIPLCILLHKSVSISAYAEAFIRSVGSIMRSLVYASVGATCLVVFGFFLGYLLARKATRLPYAVDSIAIFLFALPGAVIGIGLSSLWNTPETNFIYASMCIIIFGYIAQYTALGERIMAATFSHVPHSMEEAAQIVGAGWYRRLFKILVPLAKRGMVATWLICFIFCLRDIGITMMVYPPAHDTLPVRIFTLMANSPEDVISALCVIMIMITLLPLGGLGLVKRYIT
ncbi:MAG: ABC transporter permease component [Candidatus Scalindua rubra]|uniref:ABC transporter permease component n=1 Tax=Candidatus Scalindua rubra TaxID=1872076 RepID=A0A1E3X7Y2_9BACT|nr:MAG: ABC transporter permease component [Candidatus Scalindua rubra]